jgi:hypothetical protein
MNIFLPRKGERVKSISSSPKRKQHNTMRLNHRLKKKKCIDSLSLFSFFGGSLELNPQ